MADLPTGSGWRPAAPLGCRPCGASAGGVYRPRKVRLVKTRRSLSAALALVTSAAAASVLVVAGPAGAAVKTAPAANPHQSSDSGPAVYQDVSQPLRDLPPQAGDKARKPVEDMDRMPQQQSTTVADPVVQSSATPLIPAPSASFEGLGAGLAGFSVTGVPPDPNSAVGASQIVEIVNTSFAVFTKTGTIAYGPAATNTLWSGFGGFCQSTDDGDGVVRYDRAAARWVITQFANVRSTSGPYYECVAVSQTSDATGAYYRYAFQYSNFPDYPKLSVWPDAYYVTYNLFNSSGTQFLGAEDCALNRSAMLTGAAATQQCFTTSTSYGGLLPADVDSATAPPAGEPNLVMAMGTTSTTLAYWKFHVDWSNTAATTFTGPTNLTVASYSQACAGGTCIPQAGTTQQLDSLADRLMFRLAYRNFGDHESFVVTHSVTAGTSVGVRWYELRLSAGNPTVYQQGTFAPDAAYRWMPSGAMDRSGDIAVGYSVSSSSTNPGIRYAGRLASDALGTLAQGETTLINGTGSQTSYSRWGDYTSMSIDPADDCTFWYTDEYLTATGNFNWHTRVGSFKFAGCGGTATNDFSISASPASGSVAAGSSTTSTISTAVTSGAAQTVSLSASGLPSGATASFSPASVTAGGSSTMTIATSSTTPAGTYSVTVTGTGTSATHSTTYSLTVTSTSGCTARQLLGNPGFETGTAAPWSASAGVIDNSTAEPAHSGSWKAWLNGYGTTHTDTLRQSVNIPTGCTTYTFSFYLHIDTAETTTTTAYDKLTVKIGSTTLATYSNLNHNTGYALKSFNVSGFTGPQTVSFTGTEDASLQTSFVIDDTALNVS